MALVDNLVAGVVAAGGIAVAKSLAQGRSASIQNGAPFIGGIAMAYAIGKYQDPNGKMGGVIATGLTGGASALADIMTKKTDKLSTVTQTLLTAAAGAGANFAVEKYLNIN